MNYTQYKNELAANGFSVLANVYTHQEINAITNCITTATIADHSHTKTNNLYAIRQLINSIPSLSSLLFTNNLQQLLHTLFNGENYFLTKAIYFDKPKESNWFVAYHQDLSISVNQQTNAEGYQNFTHKHGQVGVQPPLSILENTVTVRIHLDNTTEENGALKVIAQSHLNGIIRVDAKNWDTTKEHVCNVTKGGVMLMKPLTLHASGRTTNQQQRRVIHLEFNKHLLTPPLQWLEHYKFKPTIA